jgi:hypothetical protein
MLRRPPRDHHDADSRQDRGAEGGVTDARAAMANGVLAGEQDDRGGQEVFDAQQERQIRAEYGSFTAIVAREPFGRERSCAHRRQQMNHEARAQQVQIEDCWTACQGGNNDADSIEPDHARQRRLEFDFTPLQPRQGLPSDDREAEKQDQLIGGVRACEEMHPVIAAEELGVIEVDVLAEIRI